VTAELQAAPPPPKRFKPLTLAEMVERSWSRESFLVEGLVCSTLTLIYGEPLSGKSTLAALLIASVLTDSPFLEHPVRRQVSRVVLITTEQDGPEEYGRRLSERPGIDLTDNRLQTYAVSCLSPEDWRELADTIGPDTGTLVVVDNLTQVLTGSINEDEAVREALEGLRLFTARGATVVLIGHTSEKSGQHGKSTKPMGSTAISAGVRWRVRCNANGERIELICDGNSAKDSRVVLERGEKETDLRVLETVDRRQESRKRDKETRARFAEIADWAVANGQGLKQAEMGRLLAKQYPELAPDASDPGRRVAKDLSQGRKIGGFLHRDGDGTWTRTTSA